MSMYDSLTTAHSEDIFFFFNDTATTEIYTLSLHDALPISERQYKAARIGGYCHLSSGQEATCVGVIEAMQEDDLLVTGYRSRSEEHTSELQSRQYLVCRLLLEKKKHTT